VLREIGPLNCLNEDVPILNFDLDLRLRDVLCTLVWLLLMCSQGNLLLKEFVYTSRVRLKRDDFGHSAPWGDSLSGISSNLMIESERKAICAELCVESDVMQVMLFF
jgi:hypothetical protein